LPAGLEADSLMGNHERMLLDALDDDEAGVLWLANGGGPVIESYAFAASVRGEHADHWGGLEDVLPPEHLEFLQGLKLTAQYGDYFFVHAGVRPQVPLDLQSSLDLLWIRAPFLDFAGSFDKVIVHGHTPVEAVEFHPNRIAIDTGAVFTGRLSALVLEGDRRDVLST
jgi:serine/threonine protein phosphatase 1